MSAINVTSLAAFRRFLALPGATVTVIRHDKAERNENGWNDPAKKAALFAPRTVAKLQTNAVKFSNDSWLYWDKRGGALAGALRFEGDTVTLDLSRDGSFALMCVYGLTIAVESMATLQATLSAEERVIAYTEAVAVENWIHDGQWSAADAAAVEGEGWNIFERGDDGSLEIEADSEYPIFVRDGVSYDNEAVAFVESQAAAGSVVHRRALALHRQTHAV